MLQVLGNKGAQPTQLVDQILAYCLASDADGGPTVGQYWINNIGSASVFARLYRYYIIGGTLLAMINCLHSNQARLLIAAAAVIVSVTHPAHFLTTSLILSAKL